jgi:hypothetical protein
MEKTAARLAAAPVMASTMATVTPAIVEDMRGTPGIMVEKLLPAMKAQKQAGVMEATAEKTTPGNFGIKSYPTIKYFRDGVYGKYEGPRTIEGFRTFRERMHGPAFHVLESEAHLKDLLNTSPVVFVLRTTTTPGSSSGSSFSGDIPSLFQAVAKQNQAQATFAVIQSSALSFSKVESGKHTKYMNIDGIEWGNTANKDIDRLGEFVKGNNYPLVASLDSHNFKHLGSLKRTMVIAVVDYKDAGQSKKLLGDLDAAATTLPLEQAENFVFGHLDGVQWKGFVKQYEAKVPALLLLDIAKELEAAALADSYFVERKLYPNVDFYTGVIYKAMGFPSRMFTPLFAVGRLPGWIAHWREQNADSTTRIGRPQQVYTGHTQRSI